MRRSLFSRLLLCITVFALAFGVTYGVLRLGDRADADAPEVAQDAPSLSEAETPLVPEEETSAPAQEQTAEPQDEPAEQETQTQPAESTPSVNAPPYHAEAAPDDYFADAMFFGNSLVEGLELYSLIYDENIAKARFDTSTSMTIFSASSHISEAANGGYGKIYIGLGLNEIGFEHGAIREKFEGAIDTIQAGNPDAIIYLFSLTPLSQEKSENDELYNNTNAAAISQIVREVAEEKGCYYMDMVPVLAGSDGYLPAGVTTDGVHFVKEYYPKWFDYLEHNYVLP